MQLMTGLERGEVKKATKEVYNLIFINPCVVLRNGDPLTAIVDRYGDDNVRTLKEMARGLIERMK